MRQILIEHARRRRAGKRGADPVRVSTEAVPIASAQQSIDVLALDEALERLAASGHGRAARVVELRYFGGMTIEEVAVVMSTSPATVKRDWVFARAWLRRELYGSADVHQ